MNPTTVPVAYDKSIRYEQGLYHPAIRMDDELIMLPICYSLSAAQAILDCYDQDVYEGPNSPPWSVWCHPDKREMEYAKLC